MTDKLKAQISSFVDDELMEAESELLVRRLCSDDGLRRTAARYTMIGDAMRGSLPQIQADLSSNIMRAIETEPLAAMLPAATRPSWLKAAGGGLVAAAVATVAVLALRPDGGPSSDPPAIAEDIAIVVPPDTDTVPSSFLNPAAPAVQRAGGSAAQLDQYLLMHNEYAMTTARQGVLTYRSMRGAEGAPEWRGGTEGPAEEQGARSESP